MMSKLPNLGVGGVAFEDILLVLGALKPDLHPVLVDVELARLGVVDRLRLEVICRVQGRSTWEGGAAVRQRLGATRQAGQSTVVGGVQVTRVFARGVCW